ncbi:MAG TPA: hypothetical protein PKN32_12395 [Bacteroidales bacterium]|nr:hypothetical protein [Bacteroidales bacterium]
MKNLVVILLLSSFLFSANFIIAAKYRVNNSGIGDADFTTITDAIAAAADYDTLYIEGTPVHYEGFTLAKPLVMIGPGYFLGDNPETQANPNSAIIKRSVFNPGCEGSVIIGLYFYDGVMGDASAITINESNIIFKRNRIQSDQYSDYHGYTNYTITISASVSGISFIQNYITRTNSGNGYNIRILENCAGIIFTNNYLSSQAGDAINMSTTSSAQIINNVISGNLTVKNSSLFNNIMIAGTLNHTDCSISNNIGNSTQFALPSNLQDVDMNLVFDLTNPSRDGKYQLIDDPSNPAIGYGATGEDCGMFGGIDPYRLSGLPPVPSTYFFYGSSTGSNTDGLPINIKIKSNN